MSEQQPTPGVETRSFDTFIQVFESHDTGERSQKKPPTAQERQYLQAIDAMLHKCVEFAQRLDDKKGAPLLRLLSDARERTIRLRG